MFEAIARRIVGEPEAAADDGANAPLIRDGVDGRPRIGLALGGGAARGWAHIGVLRALHEAGIRPDVVTGTSIGAVVGGCYLAGHLDGLEEWARAVTRRKIFSLLDINFGGSGLISGSRLVRLLENSLRNVTIEDLPARFVCVATELGSGHEVWLRSGPLALAMRASFALPGIFEPVAIGERWLVDGALVNPVPVSACRAFDARFVIAVNVHNATSARGTTVVDPAPLAAAPAGRVPAGDPDRNSARTLWRAQLVGHGDRPGIPTVMIESFNIIQDRISRSRLAGDPPDILVTPRVGNVGFLDFHHAAEAIAIGYEAGRRITDDVHAALEALAA